MKVVYIAGPYRADTEYQVHRNIQRAEEVAVDVWRLHAACICPHMNSAYLGGVVPDARFLDAGLEILSRCDAVIVVDGIYGVSEGTAAEIEYAKELGKPVFFDMTGLAEWLRRSAEAF